MFQNTEVTMNLDDLNDVVVASMARSLFVQAYANEEEDAGRPIGSGQDWMDCAPETPKSAWVKARELRSLIEKENGASFSSCLISLCRSEGYAFHEVPKAYLIKVGHYFAMESVGHGVSWFDDHPEFDIEGRQFTLPYFEYCLE